MRWLIVLCARIIFWEMSNLLCELSILTRIKSSKNKHISPLNHSSCGTCQIPSNQKSGITRFWLIQIQMKENILVWDLPLLNSDQSRKIPEIITPATVRGCSTKLTALQQSSCKPCRALLWMMQHLSGSFFFPPWPSPGTVVLWRRYLDSNALMASQHIWVSRY